MLRKSEVINVIGFLLAICVLIAVGMNVRKAYTSATGIHSTAQVRFAGVQKLVLGPAKIRAGKYFFAPFRIDSRMQSASIVGSFRTAGGPNNLVQVVIANQYLLGKWAAGQSIPVVHSTGRTAMAQIDVPLTQSGDYYLGFTNVFPGSDKNVFGDLELRFLTH